MTSKIHNEVTSGPSAENLFAALRWRHLNEGISLVTFTLGKGYTVSVKINSIETEDGSGDIWNIVIYNPTAIADMQYGKMFYNTNTRKGRLSIINNRG